MTVHARRDGFALPAALLALVIVGALVTGGVYAAMEEGRSSANARYGQEAFLAADRGLEFVLGTKTRPYFEAIGAVGQADTIGPVSITVGDVPAQYTVYVNRVSTRLFQVVSEGEIVGGGRYAGSKRRVSELMRVTYTYFPNDRAVTTWTNLRLRGQSGVRGMDSIPSGWSACTSLGDTTAVVAQDISLIDVHGGGGGGLYGNPEQVEDPTLDSLDFIQYGDLKLEELSAIADIQLPPGTYTGMAPQLDGSGLCDRSQQLNWGDPDDNTGACHLYWPIIHSSGDLHLSSGVGQGIMIVEGDLELTGGFEFTGIIFVYGAMRAAGTGNKVLGSTNILGSSAYETQIGTTGAGNTNLQLSSCAIERAHLYNSRFARPIPLAERKFVDMAGLGIE